MHCTVRTLLLGRLPNDLIYNPFWWTLYTHHLEAGAQDTRLFVSGHAVATFIVSPERPLLCTSSGVPIEKAWARVVAAQWLCHMDPTC